MAYKTLQELYLDSIRKYADRPCSSMYKGESLTYSEFAERVDQAVGILRRGGLVSGDKVAILSNNMPNWAVCYFATVCSGMVIVPLLSDFSPVELETLIRHCEAKALFVSDKLFSKISKTTVAQLNLVVRTMNFGIISHISLKRDASELKKALAGRGGNTEDLPLPQPLPKQGGETEIAAPATSVPQIGSGFVPKPDDLAAIIYTSGTTSAPKGVMLTHFNLASQVAMDNELFPVREDDVFLSILPLSHTFECSLGMLLPFSAGAQVVYLDKLPTASTLMPAMREVRPTVMLSVPLIIEKIYRNQVAARFKVNRFTWYFYTRKWVRKIIHKRIGRKLLEVFGGRLRFFGIGGAKLEADTERFLRDAHFPYAIGYGLTETGPLLSGAIPGKVKFRSTGPILKGVEAKLEDIDPESHEGELVVKSPSTMAGYYKNPEATAKVLSPDGWLRTRDIGYFDPEGNLYIVGRADNMIVGADGENIHPEEIESVINSHFMVTDSIVKKEQGKLVAMVRFDQDKVGRKYGKGSLAARMATLREEIMNYVNSKVSSSARISDVEEQKTEFEKTPTHKIKRFKYDSGQAGETTDGDAPDKTAGDE